MLRRLRRLRRLGRRWVRTHRPDPRAVGHRLGKALTIILVTELIIHVLNPFRIEEAIDLRAAEVIQQVTASLYGHGDAAGTPGQRLVTVVLIDRRFAATAVAGNTQAAGDAAKADAAEAVWPLPVSTLMLGVVKRILRHHPAALFIDLALPYAPREIAPGQPAAINDAMAALGRHLIDLDRDPAGPPVFLSDVIGLNDEQAAANEHCPRRYIPIESLSASGVLASAIRKQVFPPPTGAGPPPPHHLAMVDSAVLDPAGAYQLAPAAAGPWRTCQEQARAGNGYIPSPALALFAALCPRSAPPRGPDICRDPDVADLAAKITVLPRHDYGGMRLYHLDEPANEPMELRWGTNLTSTFKDAMTGDPRVASGTAKGIDRCIDQFHPSPIEPIEIYAIMLVAPIERRFADLVARPCPYINAIAPDDLDNTFQSPPPPVTAAADFPDKHRRTYADAFITGHIVLLGVDLTQAGDSYASPVNGTIPGVYVHAAAVENLLTRGSHFARAELSSPWQFVGVILIDTILLGFMTWVWHGLSATFSHRLNVFGELIVAPLIYILLLFFVGGGVIALLNLISLPLVEIAVPIVAVLLEMFGDLTRRLHHRLGRLWPI